MIIPLFGGGLVKNKIKLQPMLKIPNKVGNYTYKFRMRESVDGRYFGDDFLINLSIKAPVAEANPPVAA